MGAVAWGTGFHARKGDVLPAGRCRPPSTTGWVVSATDCPPNNTYIIGGIAAANVIDTSPTRPRS